MEIHHHPDLHHKPKPWKEYLLEGLMIFLAVTLGFFAENFREHRIEKEKETQIIESLVQCLASDTIQIKKIINETAQLIVHIDNFIKLKNADLSVLQNKTKFINEGFHGFASEHFFRTNDGALEQLKSSGMFHLMHKQSIIDSILKYNLFNKSTLDQEADYYFIWKEVFTLFRQIVDLSILRDTMSLRYTITDSKINFEFKNIESISLQNDKEKINTLHGIAAILAGTEDIYVFRLKDQLDYGKRLINYLKKEFNISP